MLGKLKVIPLLTILLLLFSISLAQAQSPTPKVPEELRLRLDQPGGKCAEGTINTAFGCIPVDTTSFTNTILGLTVGIAGLVGLLLLLFGFFTLSTSSGNPDKVKAGKEIITSAIGGLLFVIMSVVLMNFIGINILGIPGL